MHRLHPSQRQRLREAVQAAEATTSGEFVTVLAQAADRYRYIPTLWAALAALLTPLPAVSAGATWEQAYLLQVAVFFALSALFRWPPLKMRLVPRAVQQRRAYRLAREQFTNLGLHLTPNRAGVLFFVSLAEHYVEILADQGIAEHIDNTRWQALIDQFITQVHAGDVTDGMQTAIAQCAQWMAESFPPEEQPHNRLPDRLIEIEPE